MDHDTENGSKKASEFDSVETAIVLAADGSTMWGTMRTWSLRHWTVALAAGLAAALLVGLPTDVIPNPVFGRSIGVTWWSYPTLAATGILSGLLVATYVNTTSDDAISRKGGVGGLLSFFAVGCPVCNKIVLLALGTVGARRWFEPVQPYLAVLSLVLLAWALRSRLLSAAACRTVRA